MELSSATAPTVVLAEDDVQDQFLVRKAFQEARLVNDLRIVNNGAELLDYLRREGEYSRPAVAPRPGLILLDLNMPKVDGREALRAIRQDPQLCMIPVVVLTTSQDDEDIVHSYCEGANSFITKPVTFAKLVEKVRTTGEYWACIVELPPSDEERLASAIDDASR